MADKDITTADQLDAVRAEMEGIIRAAKEDGGRDLTEDESKRFETLDGDATELEKRFEAERADIERRQVEAAAREARIAALSARFSAGVTVGREEATYRPDVAERSFFSDMWRAKNGDPRAAERLQRNNAERLSSRALSTTNGQIGEFVPPLWLENEFVKLVRPGSPFANIVQHHELPMGTDSINIPKVNTGTAVAIQGTQNTAIQMTDMTTTSVSTPVQTIAGGQVVALQLIEQSPLNVDQIVLQDLAADYARAKDSFALTDATNGALNVGTQVAATGTATGAAGAAAVYKIVANTIASFVTTRYANPTHIVMHPRRWYWFIGQVDANNRPLVVPNDVAYNPMATDAVNGGQGIVGTMLGLPVVLDPSIPITLGSGTNQDAILVVKADDLWLFEGSPRADVQPQTYAQNLSVLCRLYNYIAFSAKRYAASTQVITGTQLNVLA